MFVGVAYIYLAGYAHLDFKKLDQTFGLITYYYRYNSYLKMKNYLLITNLSWIKKQHVYERMLSYC